MSVLSVLLAALGWGVVVFLPGLALGYALRPAAGLARNAALGAAAGAGATMVVAQAVDAAGATVRPLTVLPMSMGVPFLVWMWSVRGTWRDAVQRRLTRPGVPAALLLIAMVAGCLTWLVAIPSTSSVLPFTDGSHHALYAHRIQVLGTVNPAMVVSGDQASGTPTWNYYPLAIHLCAALISGFTGVAVNTVLTVGMVASAAVVLPVGIVVLTRRLIPGQDDVAGIAAIVATTFAWFPFVPVVWGGIPTIVAMTQVPAGVDALARRPGDGRALPVGVLLGLATVGIFTEHSTEAVLVVLFGLVVVLAEWRAAGSAARRLVITTWAVAAGAGAVLLIYTLPKLARGASERADYLGGGTAALSNGRWIYAIGSPLIALAALGGLALAARRRPRTPTLWCLLVYAVVFALAFVNTPITRALTLPWYSSTDRVSYAFAYFESIFAGLGIAWAMQRLRDGVAPSGRSRVRLSVATASVIATLVAFVPAIAESRDFVRSAYASESPVGADQRAGFAWLARHLHRSERVLNEFVDGSGWMETLDGVHPLFATDPETLPLVDPQRQWGDRWYLLTHAAALATDTRAQAAVRQWNVRFVYLSTEMIGHFPSRLSGAGLAASPAYRRVWHRGAVTIFSVDYQAFGTKDRHTWTR